MDSIIQSFEAKELKKRPFVIKIADYLTSIFGSISFFLINALLFGSWILINQNKIQGISPFDTFPYPLLTTIVSLEAIFLSIIVLMSQSRQNHVSTVREEIDMQINRISEKEITKTLMLLKKIAEKQGIKVEDAELDEMLKDLKLSYIERKLEEQLSEKHPSILEKAENMVEKVESKLQ